MNFIDRSALSIAKRIHNNYPEGASEAVLKYSLSLVINSVCAFITVLLIGLATGHFIQSLIVILAFTTLRYFSGGTHMSTSLSCCIFTIVTFSILTHIKFDYDILGPALDIVSIIILFFTAPRGIEKVSSVDPKFYPMLKVISMLIVASNFYFQSSLLAICFFTQAFLTTGLAFKAVDFAERRWIKHEKDHG